MLSNLPTDVNPAGDTWNAMDRLLEELTDLTRSGCSPTAYYQQLLDKTTTLLALRGAAIWRLRDDGAGLSCLTQSGVLAADMTEPTSERLQRAASLWSTRLHGDGQLHGDTLYVAVTAGERKFALLELLLRSDATEQVRAAAIQLADSIACLASAYEERRLQQVLREELDASQEWCRFLRRLQESLNLADAAYVIANEGHLITQFDRISLVAQRRRWQVMAITGVDHVDPRSRPAKALASLASAVTRIAEPVWFPLAENDEAACLPSHFEEYLDLSHAQIVGLLPVFANTQREGAPVALLIVERLQADSNVADCRRPADQLVMMSRSGLCRAIALDRHPLFRWFGPRSLQPVRRLTRTRTILLTAALLIIVACAAWPTKLRIRAAGALRPQEQRQIFAPEDGEVESILVQHDDLVSKGQPLVRLTAPELDLELTRCVGQLQVVHQQLNSVRGRRRALRAGDGTAAPFEAEQLAADEQQHLARATHLERQRELLSDRKESLTVLSPIAGQVLTWEAEQSLASRPVRRGQKLLTIADPEGPWVLEVLVPDRDVREVLRAWDTSGGDVPVAFTLAANPGSLLRGKILEIAERSEAHQGHPPSVRVVVAVDGAGAGSLRVGGAAVARIDCGQRPWGYVWCRGLWNSIRLRLF